LESDLNVFCFCFALFVCVCVCVCVCMCVCMCSCFRDIMRSFVPLRTHNIRPTHVFRPTGVWTGLIFVFSESLFIRWQIFLQIERIQQNVAFQCINHTHHTHRLCKAPKTSPGYLLHSSGSAWPEIVILETVIACKPSLEWRLPIMVYLNCIVDIIIILIVMMTRINLF